MTTFVRTAGVALLLSAYADQLGDIELRAGSLKVAEAIVQKDFRGANELAQKLAVKPGTGGKPGTLPKPFKDELMLVAVMSPLRGGSVGGLNIDRDIKDMVKAKDPKPIDPAAVELLAVRSAVINEFAVHSPNERARSTPANGRLWEKNAFAAADVSKQIVAEAAKGDKADEKKLKELLFKLNARCSDCHHTDPRDE